MTPHARAAGLALLLLCIAGAAIVGVSAQPRIYETCANPQALFDPELLGVQTAGVNVSGTRLQRSMNGYLISEDSPLPLAFTIRRTFHLPNWLIRPTTAIPGPREPDVFETRTLDIDGKAVHLRIAYAMHRGHERFAVYTLAYEGESSLSGFWLRLVESPIAVLDGIRPITYIGVAADASRIIIPEQERRAVEFLETAWRHYERACRA
jgi:hypothetical protein